MTDRACDAGIQQRLQVTDRLPETVLRNDGELHAGLITHPDHLIAFLQGRCHGLLTDNILPGLHAVNGNLCMNIGRCADIDQVDVVTGEHIMMIKIHVTVQTVLFLHLLRFSGNDVDQSCNPYTLRELLIRMDMHMRNVAGSDNGYLNHVE